MNPVSKVILGLSVCANIGMAAALWMWRDSPAPLVDVTATSGFDAAPSRDTVEAYNPTTPSATRQPGDPDPSLLDPSTIAARMKKDGFSDEAIYTALKFVFNQRLLPRQSDSRTRWHQFATPPSAEYRTQIRAAERTAKAEASRVSGITSAEDRFTYGDFGWEKIAAIREIEEEWGEAGPKAEAVFARDQIAVNGRATIRTATARAEVQREMLSGLSAVLSPEELDQYLQTKGVGGMNGITQLQDKLTGLAIDDETYRRLADATLISQFRNPTAGTPGQRYAHQTALLQQYRQLLGDENFARATAKLDRVGSTLEPVLQASSVPLSMRAELFFKVRELTAAVQYGDPASRAANRAEAVEQVAATAGLGPEQKAVLGNTLFPEVFR